MCSQLPHKYSLPVRCCHWFSFLIYEMRILGEDRSFFQFESPWVKYCLFYSGIYFISSSHLLSLRVLTTALNYKVSCYVACCAEFPPSLSTQPLPYRSLLNWVVLCLMKGAVRPTSVHPPPPWPLIPSSAEQWCCQTFLSCEQSARQPDIHKFRSFFSPLKQSHLQTFAL